MFGLHGFPPGTVTLQRHAGSVIGPSMCTYACEIGTVECKLLEDRECRVCKALHRFALYKCLTQVKMAANILVSAMTEEGASGGGHIKQSLGQGPFHSHKVTGSL